VLKGELGYKGPVKDKIRADTLFIKLRPELRIEISRRGNPLAIRRGLINVARYIETSERLFEPERLFRPERGR
jgi:hypothetical protein